MVKERTPYLASLIQWRAAWGSRSWSAKNSEFKRWLLCGGASTKGKKVDLAGTLVTVGFNMPRDNAWHSYVFIKNLYRVRDYIKSDWANKLIDPDGNTPTQSTSASFLAPSQQRLPNSDQPTEWKDIKSSYRDPVYLALLALGC